MRRDALFRLTALLLAVVLLFTTTAFASAVEPETATDDELIAQYDIADNWSREALLFSVRKGLLRGMSDGMLHPKDSATRAEVAAILIRILRTTQEADISGISDMKPTKWYYDDMAQAVAAGIFVGDNTGLLQPDKKITRQEAFAVIARMLGLISGNEDTIYRFKDASSVSGWAKGYITAMAEVGYLNGDSSGKLNPRSSISRQELAQVFYNIFGDISDSVPGEYSGKMLAAATDTVASGSVIHGDLLLSGESAELNLENIIVEGKLIIQGCGELKLTVSNCFIGELVLCRPTRMAAREFKGALTVQNTATLDGDFDTVTLRAKTTLNGNAKKLGFCSGVLNMTQTAQVEQLEVRYSAEDAAITLDGTVQSAWVRAMNVQFDGSGKIDVLNITKTGCVAFCRVGETNTSLDQGIAGVTLKRTDSAKPTEKNPNADISVRMFGANNDGGFFEDGVRTCRAAWYVNNKLLDSTDEFALSSDLTDSRYIDFSSYLDSYVSVPICVCLTYEGKTVVLSFNVELEGTIYFQARNIKTGQIKATVKYDTGLYAKCSNSGLSGWIKTVKAGTQVTYHAYWGNSYAQIWLSDGTIGWVGYYAISISSAPAYTKTDYSKEVKESFVNAVRSYSSSSGYLIWVSLYTQRVNIFEGSKGNWKLVKNFACATGSNYTPTPVEETTILYKTARWNFGAYYCHHVSVIDNGGRAFHSRTYRPDGHIYDPTMGQPVSHGCIRMEDVGCEWIYNNCPNGTKVFIW